MEDKLGDHRSQNRRQGLEQTRVGFALRRPQNLWRLCRTSGMHNADPRTICWLQLAETFPIYLVAMDTHRLPSVKSTQRGPSRMGTY